MFSRRKKLISSSHILIHRFFPYHPRSIVDVEKKTEFPCPCRKKSILIGSMSIPNVHFPMISPMKNCPLNHHDRWFPWEMSNVFRHLRLSGLKVSAGSTWSLVVEPRIISLNIVVLVETRIQYNICIIIILIYIYIHNIYILKYNIIEYNRI